MPLKPGSRLGIYEVIAPLGAGGMGEVYVARDTRLGRDVAIKALPDHFAQDPDRVARFEREARLLASLSHPNIAGIFGLEDVDGHRYLILEYAEGESLKARFDRAGDCSRTRGRARERDRTPRFEARQHCHHTHRERQTDRLRSRQRRHDARGGAGRERITRAGCHRADP